jgi:hypothetical protein
LLSRSLFFSFFSLALFHLFSLPFVLRASFISAFTSVAPLCAVSSKRCAILFTSHNSSPIFLVHRVPIIFPLDAVPRTPVSLGMQFTFIMGHYLTRRDTINRNVK